MSNYSIYSKPQIDSQHVQNIISCSIKIKQTKANQEIFQTSVYQTYHDLKAKSFPRTDLEKLLEKAKQTIPKTKHLDIKCFFKRKAEDIEAPCSKKGRQDKKQDTITEPIGNKDDQFKSISKESTLKR